MKNSLRKSLSLILVCLMFVLTACNTENVQAATNTNKNANISNTGTSLVTSNASRANNSANASRASKTTEETEKIDIDLVRLNSTMLYSQITNIQNDYKEYLGKRIRLIGTMGIIDGQEGKKYFTVNTTDPTACCSASFEYLLKGGSQDPKDYPAAGQKIRVSGVLKEYKEGQSTYLHLTDSDIYIYKK